MRQSLEGLGCAIVRQDGTGVDEDIDAVCVSTAIEESNPDIAAARSCGLPIVHRSDLLAAIIASKRTIAVAGTSGKSTVTAMIFEFLTACGKSPSLISGAPLLRLEKQGLIGNAFSGGSDLLVVEADESDGTLVKYAPEAAVILNISKDHKSVDEIKGLFETLISRATWTATNADDPVLAALPATTRFRTIRLGLVAAGRERSFCRPRSSSSGTASSIICPIRGPTTSKTCGRPCACASISAATRRALSRCGKSVRGRGPALFRDRDGAERVRGR